MNTHTSTYKHINGIVGQSFAIAVPAMKLHSELIRRLSCTERPYYSMYALASAFYFILHALTVARCRAGKLLKA